MIELMIRKAIPDDLTAIRQLFYDTVTTVNTRDYNPAQISAWAAGWTLTAGWESRVREQHFLLAVDDEQIVGFSSLTDEGYLDVMYVHRDRQGQGIASRLLDALEAFAGQSGIVEIRADVSLTALPFFNKRGFHIDRQYQREVRGATFLNTVMSKKLPSL